MKQIIENLMKNLCHNETMSASRITPSSDTSCHLLPPMGRRQFSFGFTLAEVLITLGIIGVVAALTLPSLIQNYQKQVWVNQLKKAVNVWENGMKMMLADADTDELRNTEFWQHLNGDQYGYGYIGADYTVQNNILKKYFKVLKFCEEISDVKCAFAYKYKNLNGEISNYGIDELKIYMSDGTLYGFWDDCSGAEGTEYCGRVCIDVNGDSKGPNQWGRDTFQFCLLANGTLLPCLSYERLKQYPSYCADLETGDISNATGEGCAARIIADGWKMNY